MANILIIDDDPTILRLLEFALKRAGHSVTVCADGMAGLASVTAQLPDLIVADVMMPKMTGHEFCKHVRTQLGLQETPIIMFSARFQPIDKQTALEAGATDYLPKTSSPDLLIQRITELLPNGAPSLRTRAMVGLFSLRGGAGVSTLAVNIAIALARSHQAQPALIDLAPLGGHIALMLGLRPANSVISALTAAKDRFTPDTLKPHFIAHPSGVQVLASALLAEQELRLADPRLEQLLPALKSGFPWLILDLPHLLEPRFVANFQLFDKILLLLTPDMPSLQSTAVALQGLARLGIAEDKIALVVNHVLPHGALPVETIQKAIRRPVLHTIPFEPEMSKAVNSGKPLLLSAPHSAGAAAIAKLTQILLS